MKIFRFLTLILLPSLAISQTEQHSKWTYTISKNEVSVGEEIELIFKVKIDNNWDVYSSDFDPNVGPTVTTFTYKPSSAFKLIGKVKPIGAKKKFDEIFGGEVSFFLKAGEFRQKIKVLNPLKTIEGSIEYQECSDGKCIPHEIDFSFNIKVNSSDKLDHAEILQDTGKVSQSSVIPSDTSLKRQTSDTTPREAIELSKETADFNKTIIEGSNVSSQNNPNSLWGFMIGAFIAGFLALLTPCVYPMIPMTVTFFSNNSQNRSAAIIKAIIYGVSIIIIYTFLGIITSAVFGPDALNYASTHWITNIIFFSVFIIFALSFFGLFEITLPSSFVNKVDQQADKGGYYGIFFMAFTIVLVSFSCTGPIVGSILLAAAQGELLKPAIGMFGFSMAFALPFTLFAIFPNWLQSLPKSGGWLNSVKVVLGFIELALAFKFLSVADQVYHWGILDRDIFIIIWISIFTFMALYLLGKFKLAHDSEIKHLSILRMFFAIITVGFIVYLIPGLFGAPLKGISGLLPPLSTHDFNIAELINGGSSSDEGDKNCEPAKYGDLLKIPHGINGYFDYSQALKCARTVNKPLFIDFTGHGCTNCREMEANVWSNPGILRKMKEDFVVVALYIDERTELSKEEVYTSDYDKKLKNTIGKKNFDIEKKIFYSNAQPYYCIVDHRGKLLVKPKQYDRSIENFLSFLNEGLKSYKKRI